MALLIGLGFGTGLWLFISSFLGKVPALRKSGGASTTDARIWPRFIDDVASGVRAGLAIPNAIWQAGSRLPAREKASFMAAERAWQQGSGLQASLEELAAALRSPSFDLFAETVRIAFEQGSSRFPALLSELAEQQRSHQALADEVRGRQATTVNAARVAVIAPWLVLVVTGSRADVRASYQSTTGLLVLLMVAALCAVAYFAMHRISKIDALTVLK